MSYSVMYIPVNYYLLFSGLFNNGRGALLNISFVRISSFIFFILSSVVMVQSTAMADNEKELYVKIDNSVMILVPKGEFIYGIKKDDRDRILKQLSTANFEIFKQEFNETKKYLDDYYVDKYEVTNRQYEKFVDVTGHKKSKYWNSNVFNKPKQPVVGVGWADAEKYCKWTGKRLPDEEEWEKAARGADGRIWPWGNKPTSEKYNGKAQGNNAPVDVGSYMGGASPYGVMDMAGNVYEMTTGKWSTDSRAMRGGSFLNAGALSRTMFRWAAKDEINGARWLGFRCVK